jgi:hypothetical protein
MRVLIASIALWMALGAGPAQAAEAPQVLYLDTLTAPGGGGEQGQGGYLSIFGRHFGNSNGLGSHTRVFIGPNEVSSYRYLGASKVGAKLGIEQITVQVGRQAHAGIALPVRVVVDGVQSNADQSFTPTDGHVLFVSLDGNDASARPDEIGKPWRHLQVESSYRGAYFAAAAGDQIVLRGGHWTDVDGVDGTWMRASKGASARNGRASAWIHVTAYPGPDRGNAPEDVHYTAPAGHEGGIAGPWSAIAGTSGNYWAVSNLRMDVDGRADRDAAPINFQYAAGPWRVVNNELGPWPVHDVERARSGGIAGAGTGMVVLGNHIHDIAGTSALENHGIYVETYATQWEIAYNWIHDITGGSLVQFFDPSGVAGDARTPSGEPWPGFVGMRVHHNWLQGAAKYGLNIGDTGAPNGRVELQAWNNVIVSTRLPPVRMKSSANRFNVTIAYNTIVDAMTSDTGTNAYFRNEGHSAGAVRILNNLLAFGPHTHEDTVWFNDRWGDSTGWVFGNNLYWPAGRRLAPQRGDGLPVEGDPRFSDPVRGQFSPATGSPALWRALLPTPMLVDDDLWNRPRQRSGNNDIGAIQATAAGPARAGTATTAR